MIVRLTAPPTDDRRRFTSLEIAPGRAMMLLQACAELPGLGETPLIWTPPRDEVAKRLSPRVDRWGNAAFAFGGAILAPYANRITGRHDAASAAIVAAVDGRGVRLPANGGGKREGAARYAIHGLILDRAVDEFATGEDGGLAYAEGLIRAGDFKGRWPGEFDLSIRWSLSVRTIALTVTATNVGAKTAPIGLGWHPYFALPSGRRETARLYIPARSRVEVNDYDEVLPTGRLLPTSGSPYDVAAAEGLELGDLYLDDCFTDLEVGEDARAVITLTDPAAGHGLRITASPPAGAVQTYAPPDQAFVVIEPQFNLADPYARLWAGRDTGMVQVEPGGTTQYAVELSLFEP